MLHSLLRTCALHGVDTYAHPIDIIDKLASGWPQSRIAHTTIGERIKTAGRELASDPDLQAGIAQVVMALAALAVRALTAAPPPDSTETVA